MTFEMTRIKQRLADLESQAKSMKDHWKSMD